MQINIFFINDKSVMFFKKKWYFFRNIITSRNSYKILNRTKTDTGEWV